MTETTKPDWMKNFVPIPVANKGRWVKGQSGNPKGRPPGRPDARTKITRALMDEGLEIARVVTDAAKDGDLQAASIVLARIAPSLRPEAQPVQFEFDPTASTVEQVEAILAAVASGAVPVDLGKQLIESVKALADVRAVQELEARLAALEAKQ